MSRARHSGKGQLGSLPSTTYAGGASKVVDAAQKKKSGFKGGGKVPGGKAKGRADKFARGGAVSSPYSSAASPKPKSMS